MGQSHLQRPLWLFWEAAPASSNFITSSNGIGPVHFHFEICVLIVNYFLFTYLFYLYKGLSLVMKVHM